MKEADIGAGLIIVGITLIMATGVYYCLTVHPLLGLFAVGVCFLCIGGMLTS